MRYPRLDELPTPPEEKIGWPWTEQSEPLPDKMPDGSEWPRISIVTPSYNQGQFIEETIRSVLLQGYPNLEYIIIDGGSTDNSVEIIKKYEPWIFYWVSESDRGQAHAINKGFRNSSGKITAFLNSDDVYLPVSLAFIAELFSTNLQGDFICGKTRFIDANSSPKEGFSELFNVEINYQTMTEECHIAQPSTFFRSIAFQEIGFFNESLQYCFDYDFWLRAFLAGMIFVSSQEVLSSYRLHDSTKTASAYPEGKFDRDFISIYQSALAKRDINFEIRSGLRRGLAIAVTLLFIHLEASKGIKNARLNVIKIIRQTPEVLLNKGFYKTLLIAISPLFLRVIWRNLRKREVVE
jgi:glycosyltransferase involved in cell wall biosynthesis